MEEAKAIVTKQLERIHCNKAIATKETTARKLLQSDAVYYLQLFPIRIKWESKQFRLSLLRS